MKIGKTGVGLANLGNTCFMNSVLQCLAYLPSLQRLLADPEQCAAAGGGPLGKALLATLRGIWTTSKVRFSPTELHGAVKKAFPQFRRGSQEDAHEFFRALVDGVDLERRDSFVRSLFQLNTTSVLTCHGCASSQVRVEEAFDLSLSWPEQPAAEAVANVSGKRGKKKKKKGGAAAREEEPSTTEEKKEEEETGLELVTMVWPVFAGKRFPVFVDASLPRLLDEEDSTAASESATTAAAVAVVARADTEKGRYDARRRDELGAAPSFSLLQRFSDPEVLSGSDKYFCSKCNSKQCASKVCVWVRVFFFFFYSSCVFFSPANAAGSEAAARAGAAL